MMTVVLTITTINGEEVIKFTKPALECGIIVAKAHDMFGEDNIKIEYLD